MIEVTYGITEEKYSIGSKTRISYGIAAYSNTESDGTSTVVASVHDITDEKERLAELVDRCNRLKLSVVHLLDVVEDFLV